MWERNLPLNGQGSGALTWATRAAPFCRDATARCSWGNTASWPFAASEHGHVGSDYPPLQTQTAPTDFRGSCSCITRPNEQVLLRI